MLNVLITLLFVVICIFQPWMAAFLLFWWLLGKKEQEVYQQRGQDLVQRIDEIFAEEPEPEPEYVRPVRQKPNLRIVK